METPDSVPMIKFRSVTKLYKTVIGVNDIDLELKPGAYGLLGPNGSGKTTLINLLMGQLQPTLGTVEVFGKNPWGNDNLLSRIGLCPAADVLYPNVTAFDWVRYLVELYGFSTEESKDRAEAALEQVKMTENMHRPIGTYSLGMRQRSKLAQSIAHEPDLLILDEPFNGLDPIGRFEMAELLKQMVNDGKSLIIASHILHEVEAIKPDFLLISGGRLLASGSMKEVREHLIEVPNELFIRTSDRRKMAEVLVHLEQVVKVDFGSRDGALNVSTKSLYEMMKAIPKIAAEHNLEIYEVRTEEGSLQQLFGTLMKIHRGEI